MKVQEKEIAHQWIGLVNRITIQITLFFNIKYIQNIWQMPLVYTSFKPDSIIIQLLNNLILVDSAIQCESEIRQLEHSLSKKAASLVQAK